MALAPTRGKELPFMVYAPSELILQVTSLLDAKAAGVHGRIHRLFADIGGKVLAGYLQTVGDDVELTCFLSISNVEKLEEVIDRAKSLKGVKEFKAFGPYKSIAVDDVHFPFTTRRGARMIVFSAVWYSRVLARLRDLFGSGADVILYEMGKKHGQEMAEAMLEMARGAGVDLKPSSLAELMLRYLQSCGWAAFKLSIVKEHPLEAAVQAEELFEALSKGPGCSLFRGELEGLFSTIYGVEVKVSEEVCRARGEAYCLFRITAK